MARAVEVRKATRGMYPTVMQVRFRFLFNVYITLPHVTDCVCAPMFSQGGGPLQGFCLWNALSTPTSPILPFFFNLTTISPQPSALMCRPSTSSRSPISLDVGHQLLGDGEQVQALPDVATQAGGEGDSGKGQEAHMPLLWWVGSKFFMDHRH